MPHAQSPAAAIEESLAAIVALLERHGEHRWAAAFARVAEHVSVTRGADDPRSPARTVRDLLHMFGDGLGAFVVIELTVGGVIDPDATRELHTLHRALHATVAHALGRPLPAV